MANTEAIIKNVVALCNNPNAVPEFVWYVIRKNPSTGQDSPRKNVLEIKYLLKKSSPKTTKITENNK